MNYQPFPKIIESEMVSEPTNGQRISVGRNLGSVHWDTQHKSWVCDWDGSVLSKTNLVELRNQCDHNWYQTWKNINEH